MRWHIAIFFAGFRRFGRLPLPILHRIGAALGWLLWASHGSLRHKAARTLGVAFPDMNEQDRATLLRRSLSETGKSIVEVAKIWSGDAQALELIREVRGAELFDAALGSGRGLIIAAPHLGCWEILNFYLCSKTPMTIVYRPPRKPVLEPLLVKARGALAAEQVRAEGAGVRTLYKKLSSGGVVGILPDQQPKQGEGHFAPFFGTPALTMVMLSRLANRTGAQVLFGVAERLARGAGYRVHFLPAPPDIDSSDPSIATGALNRGVEQCVQLAPDQYQWHYKRYSIRPAGDARRIYRRG